MNKKKIAVATALAALVLWTIAPSKSTRANRVLANAFPAKLLAAPSSCTTPEWPAEARRYEVEGITLLHFHINADGGIEDAQVAGSSSWSMLDDAALASLVKCKFKANLDEAARDATYPIQFVWTLAGPPSNRPQLVADSCPASPRFAGFEEFNRAPSADDGVLVRFLVDPDGKPFGIKAEGAERALGEAVAAYLAACRFALDASVPGETTDTVFGRVLRRR